MKVGLCNTKPSANNIRLYECIAKGIKACGDKPILIQPNEVHLMKSVDVTIQIGMHTLAGHVWNNFRKKVVQVRKNKPCAFIDAGYFKHQQRYCVLSLFDVKNKGTYGVVNANYERLDKLELDIAPWRTDGDKILILGQNPLGYVKKPRINQIYAEWVKKLKETTDKEIVFRPHPMADMNVRGAKKLSKRRPDLKAILKDGVWACVTYSSNCSIESLLHGVPCITMSDINISWDYSSHKLEQVEDPFFCDRRDFFARVADIQHNLDEYAEGRPWRRIKSCLI